MFNIVLTRGELSINININDNNGYYHSNFYIITQYF